VIAPCAKNTGANKTRTASNLDALIFGMITARKFHQ